VRHPLGPVALFAVIFVAAVSACHRRDEAGSKAGPAAGSPPALSGAPARAAASHALPFTHPLLSQAGPHIAHENCSKEALWMVAYQLRDVHKKAERARVDQVRRQGRNPAKKQVKAAATAGGPSALSCPTPEADELGRQVRSETMRRVGACVGQDKPLDPEWDMVNSGVLALGVCLDCGRSPEARAKDCKNALDVIDRADKLAHGQAGAEIPPRESGVH
jgi:hypothetical protein